MDKIIGNIKQIEYLNKMAKNSNILHSYLFLGIEGIGKKLIAKEFAKKVLCIENAKENCKCKSCICFDGENHPDYTYVDTDTASIGINQIRELTKKVIEKPIISNRKVYIINDSEKMTKEAQNSLLKTLEEPPEFAIIILISSNENLILNTIKSRCMKLNFQPISNSELKEYILKKSNYSNISENMLKAINGSIGKSEKIIEKHELYEEVDKFVEVLDKKDKIEILKLGKVLYDKENIYDILDYLNVCLYLKKDYKKSFLDCIEIVNKTLLKLKLNCNFEMSIDFLIMDIWGKINENCNRN